MWLLWLLLVGCQVCLLYTWPTCACASLGPLLIPTVEVRAAGFILAVPPVTFGALNAVGVLHPGLPSVCILAPPGAGGSCHCAAFHLQCLGLQLRQWEVAPALQPICQYDWPESAHVMLVDGVFGEHLLSTNGELSELLVELC